MEYYGENNLLIQCDNGLVAETAGCPCGCPSFDGRSIIYVDKHASGTRDGSSWVNAYTDIQTAINAHPKKEIQIKGYGESDFYPAGITLLECTYIKGIGDVWIDGAMFGSADYICGIHGAASTKVEYINIKNCLYSAFYLVTHVNNCLAKECDSIGANEGVFRKCDNVHTCQSYGIMSRDFVSGFSDVINAIDCIANDHSGRGLMVKNDVDTFCSGCTADNNVYEGMSVHGASSVETHTFIDCIVTNSVLGGFGGHRCELINCTASGTKGIVGNQTAGYGFGMSDSTLTNCSSTDNANCGYTWNTTPLINCTESNNCLGYWMRYCGPGYCRSV